MSARSGQHTFRLNEQRRQIWAHTLSESGMTQQAAIDTLVDALGARTIDLNSLRAEAIRVRREQEAADEA